MVAMRPCLGWLSLRHPWDSATCVGDGAEEDQPPEQPPEPPQSYTPVPQHLWGLYFVPSPALDTTRLEGGKHCACCIRTPTSWAETLVSASCPALGLLQLQ